MGVRMIRLTGILLVLFVARATPAEETQRTTLQIPRVFEPPKLEDFLSGRDAQSQHNSRDDAEAEVTVFRQREPGDGIPVSQETRAYLSYDDQNLFVIFVCKDDPAKVRARMAKREDIESDDQVVLYLDTFRDGQRAYVFATNPLGIQRDGIITEGQEDDFSFDTLWRSEGRLTPDGYAVKMSIPFKSIRFSNDSEQAWGIALGRIIPRADEESYWPYITKRIDGLVQQFAVAQGLDRISPGRNLQFIPHGILTRARFLDPEVPDFVTATDKSIGLDGKLVLRDAFTLDMTLNPDFSQVESDEPQVTINQRFEVFFPEKRPFFIENAGFFQTPINLFFSRRIVDPQYGARLTGKAGRWALGALAIDDPAAGRSAESESLANSRAGIGVFRVQREFGQQSYAGILMTSRDFASSSNRVVSLDTRLKLSPTWFFTAQAGRSFTEELDGPRLSGSTYFAELAHESRHVEYFGRYLDFSPDFRSQVGFIKRVDIRQTEHRAKYRWRPESGPVLKFGPSLRTLFNWNRQGRLQDREVELSFDVDLHGKTALELSHTRAYELFEDLGFRKRATGISLSTEWFKWLTISAAYSFGTDVNFDPAPGLAPFLARAREGELQLTLRPTPRFRFDQSFIYSGLRASKNSILPEGSSSSVVFNNPILRWKVNYQFTRELSLRAIVDYEAVRPNTGLVDLEEEKRFAADILLTYLLNPGTALHVGYTDNYENLDFTDTGPRSLRRVRSPFNSTGRQVFFKVSYLWRK